MGNVSWLVITYYIGRVCVLYLEKVHGSYHALHGHEYVLVDQFDEASLIFVRVSGTVNDSHLFNER